MQLKWSALSIEVKASVLAFLFFLISWGVIVVVNDSLDDEKQSLPCGLKSPQFNCYNLRQEACTSAWTHYEEGCLNEIKSNVQGPTQLIGSAVKKCTMVKFEQYMSFNKKNQDSQLCQAYFELLKK